MICLFAESGISIAVMRTRSENGNQGYAFSDPSKVWPENKDTWYYNYGIRVIVANTIFALATQGLLKVCERIENPLAFRWASYPEDIYDAALYNNAKAFQVAYKSPVVEKTN